MTGAIAVAGGLGLAVWASINLSQGNGVFRLKGMNLTNEDKQPELAAAGIF